MHKKLTKPNIGQYMMFLADKQPSAALVLNTYDIHAIFEDLDSLGLLKGKDYTTEKIEPDTRKVINLTRLGTFIVKPPHGEYQVYPISVHLDFDSIIAWLDPFPITTECWVLYDIEPARVMYEHNQSVLNNQPRWIDSKIADLIPVCNSHDIVKGTVKLIKREVRDIAAAFIDDIYWQILEDHTNIFTTVKKTDSVEKILGDYINIPTPNEPSYRLCKELLGFIYQHEEMIIRDVIDGEKNMIYLNQSIGNFQQVITKYNIDYRIAAYEVYFQEFDEASGAEDDDRLLKTVKETSSNSSAKP